MTRFAPAIVLLVVLCLAGCGGTQAPAPFKHFGADGGANSAGVHTVSEGDTLWSIAGRYKLAMPDIIYLNNLTPPYELRVNERLTLPPPNTYKVKPQDNLYAISQTFDVSMNQIARLNNMSAPYTIHAGETLRLPSVQPAAASPAAKPAAVASSRVKPAVKRAVSRRTPPRAGGKFSWPADGPIISSYGPKKDGLHNDGINISAPRGAPVRAAENGVVVYADDELEGFGNLVLIRHADRWMTAYGHLERSLVKRGQEIKRGQTLGAVGSSGNVDSPQLHFEIRRGMKAINPEFYLAGRGT